VVLAIRPKRQTSRGRNGGLLHARGRERKRRWRWRSDVEKRIGLSESTVSDWLCCPSPVMRATSGSSAITEAVGALFGPIGARPFRSKDPRQRIKRIAGRRSRREKHARYLGGKRARCARQIAQGVCGRIARRGAITPRQNRAQGAAVDTRHLPSRRCRRLITAGRFAFGRA